jgi:predicted SnoaL-like aldol condensation-catalyzing enzyme
METRDIHMEEARTSGVTSTVTRKQVAVSFLRDLAAGKARAAFDALVAPNFRHHNAYFAGDARSLMNAIDDDARKNPDKVLDIQHALEDGDLVAVHSHVRQHSGDPGIAVVHLVRFQGDKIVEFWDVAQQVPPESPNENGMF